MRTVSPTRTLLALLLWTTLAGCVAGDVQLATGPGAGTIGHTGGGTLDPALVGVWDRTIVFEANGQRMVRQTTWTFRADGTASRAVIARDESWVLYDITVTEAMWSTIGDIVTFGIYGLGVDPERFHFALIGTTTLVLDDVAFTRIG